MNLVFYKPFPYLNLVSAHRGKSSGWKCLIRVAVPSLVAEWHLIFLDSLLLSTVAVELCLKIHTMRSVNYGGLLKLELNSLFDTWKDSRNKECEMYIKRYRSIQSYCRKQVVLYNRSILTALSQRQKLATPISDHKVTGSNLVRGQMLLRGVLHDHIVS